MADLPEFRLNRYPGTWLGGEPHVFAINAEDDITRAYNLEGACLLTVAYQGGGLGNLFNRVVQAARVPECTSFQALLENLGDLSDQKPLILFIRNGDRILADVGPALIHVLAGWEQFSRHGSGVHSMYLVI